MRTNALHTQSGQLPATTTPRQPIPQSLSAILTRLDRQVKQFQQGAQSQANTTQTNTSTTTESVGASTWKAVKTVNQAIDHAESVQSWYKKASNVLQNTFHLPINQPSTSAPKEDLLTRSLAATKKQRERIAENLEKVTGSTKTIRTTTKALKTAERVKRYFRGDNEKGTEETALELVKSKNAMVEAIADTIKDPKKVRNVPQVVEKEIESMADNVEDLVKKAFRIQ